jgi:hypothetical protein
MQDIQVQNCVPKILLLNSPEATIQTFVGYFFNTSLLHYHPIYASISHVAFKTFQT